MVDIHLSEEEQVEELKKWWKENGRSVVAGVVLGLGGVFGWQYWTQHQQTVAEQAAYQFQQLTMAVARGTSATAVKQAEGLINDYPGSTYAVFAALNLAKLKQQEGDSAAAGVHLQWAVDNTDDASLQQIARLRIARLLLNEGDVDAAATIAATGDTGSFQGDFLELQGDIALKKGNREAARQAYQEALAMQVSNIALVQMKFDDLAASGNQ